jgi:hypothetical protein
MSDDVTPLWQQLDWDELVDVAEWLEDLDSPLLPEQVAEPGLTASARIRRARELHEAGL